MSTAQATVVRGKPKWPRFLFLFDKTRTFHFFLSTAFVGIAFSLRMLLNPEVGPAMPFTFFVTASILSALVGGWVMGVYSMILGWFLGDLFFVPPIGTVGVYSKVSFISLVANFFPNTIAIIALELLHRSRKARMMAEAQLAAATEKIKEHNAMLDNLVKQRTLELEGSLKFFENFCYSIAHDLRAPLRAIRGFALALDEDYGKRLDVTAREYTNRMASAVEKMDRLITDLLDYGRLSHQPLDFEDVPISEAVQAALATLGEQIREIRPDIESKNLDVTVHVSRYLLEDVLRRLLSNALKFRRTGVQLKITIEASVHESSVRISVSDNGIGIDRKYLRKIFGLFQTLEPTFDTGAGLAFVSKAVERMHGRVGVDSIEGQGSTFWIELPKGHGEARVAAAYSDAYAR